MGSADSSVIASRARLVSETSAAGMSQYPAVVRDLSSVNLDIGLLIRTDRHIVLRNIGDTGERIVELALDLLERRLFRGHALLDVGDFAHESCGMCLVLLRLCLADFLGCGVAALLQGLK